MRKEFTKDIRGTTYKVYQLGAKEGSRLLVRLTKTLGKALADGKPNVGAIMGAVDETELSHMIDVLAPKTEVIKGDAVLKLSDIFDEHFSGDYDGLIDWLVFALESNYSDFIAALPVRLAALAAKKDVASKDSSTPPTT